MHLSSWPTDDVPGLTETLERLHTLLPSQQIQTHLLHLASNGEILPHVDNVSASGSWILGVSLGAERILRMIGQDKSESFDTLLPSGSVYIQKYVDLGRHATIFVTS
jgi:alkylated DNA repair protein alkB homolog 7